MNLQTSLGLFMIAAGIGVAVLIVSLIIGDDDDRG